MKKVICSSVVGKLKSTQKKKLKKKPELGPDPRSRYASGNCFNYRAGIGTYWG